MPPLFCADTPHLRHSDAARTLFCDSASSSLELASSKEYFDEDDPIVHEKIQAHGKLSQHSVIRVDDGDGVGYLDLPPSQRSSRPGFSDENNCSAFIPKNGNRFLNSKRIG